MKHKKNGQIDNLRYSHNISLLRTHKERMDYMSDIDPKWHDLIYLTAMQMGLPKTIASLPTREERKKAWQELPDHNKTLEGMKNMVYHRVVKLFGEGYGNGRKPLQKGWNDT
jgi:hypothetical protein